MFEIHSEGEFMEKSFNLSFEQNLDVHNEPYIKTMLMCGRLVTKAIKNIIHMFLPLQG